MSTTKQISRWLLVLPGAILVGIIVMFPIHWTAMFIQNHGSVIFGMSITKENGESLMSLESIERYMDALFVSGSVVAASARIAPRFHFLTAIVITLCIIGLGAVSCAHLKSSGLRLDDSPFRLAVNFTLCLISVICALFYARDLDAKPASYNRSSSIKNEKA